MRGQHDRALVVAGVTDQAMIEDFATAIIAATETCDRRAFATTFDSLVEKYGWSCNGGREWRISTIFETSIRTSYMAGRLKQMRDPDVVKLMPYWQYRHADTRVPKSPRLRHLAWDGLVLDWDDPWWDVHYPPNDWMCSCGVHALSRGEVKRLDKTGPDIAPAIVRRPYTHEASGETVMQPDGVGFGWDYMPGRPWTDGLVPSALLQTPGAVEISGPRLRNLVLIDDADPIDALLARARPFQSAPMAAGLPREDYLSALLTPFGATPSQPVLWPDVTGHRLMIAADMWIDAQGWWKGAKRGHAVYAPLIAEALMEPDEIWIGLREMPWPVAGALPDIVLTRRYIRVDPSTGLFVLFDLARIYWEEDTGYAALNGARPDFRHIDTKRVGQLLWRRQ